MVRETLVEINRERARYGASPLRMHQGLARAARRHSKDMVERSYFAHDAPGGGAWQSRIRATGILRGARRSTMGENIAWGRDTCGSPRAIVKAWMDSPPHRHVMLLARFTHVGIGIVPGTPSHAREASATYTADFAYRR
jgi:uncharacterized protein YkwD